MYEYLSKPTKTLSEVEVDLKFRVEHIRSSSMETSFIRIKYQTRGPASRLCVRQDTNMSRLPKHLVLLYSTIFKLKHKTISLLKCVLLAQMIKSFKQ